VQLHTLQCGLQLFAQLPALAQCFEIGGVAAALLDTMQRRQRIAQAGEFGDARGRRSVDLLRQPATGPERRQRPRVGARRPASTCASTLLPTPLRPTSPVGRASKVSSRSENSSRPSGSCQETRSSVRKGVVVIAFHPCPDHPAASGSGTSRGLASAGWQGGHQWRIGPDSFRAAPTAASAD